MNYDELIMEHGKYPYYKEKPLTKDGRQLCVQLKNASCGDKLTITVVINMDTIVDGSFSGIGCLVSQASADIMLDCIVGRRVIEGAKMLAKAREIISGGYVKSTQGRQDGHNEGRDEREVELSEEMMKFAKGMRAMPAREKCAILPYGIVDVLAQFVE